MQLISILEAHEFIKKIEDEKKKKYSPTQVQLISSELKNLTLEESQNVQNALFKKYNVFPSPETISKEIAEQIRKRKAHNFQNRINQTFDPSSDSHIKCKACQDTGWVFLALDKLAFCDCQAGTTTAAINQDGVHKTIHPLDKGKIIAYPLELFKPKEGQTREEINEWWVTTKKMSRINWESENQS
jgi:hypothetical protein